MACVDAKSHGQACATLRHDYEWEKQARACTAVHPMVPYECAEQVHVFHTHTHTHTHHVMVPHGCDEQGFASCAGPAAVERWAEPLLLAVDMASWLQVYVRVCMNVNPGNWSPK